MKMLTFFIGGRRGRVLVFLILGMLSQLEFNNIFNEGYSFHISNFRHLDMVERDRIRALLADALLLLSPGTSFPENNTSWANISTQQHEASSTINANTVALQDPVVSNFQR